VGWEFKQRLTPTTPVLCFTPINTKGTIVALTDTLTDYINACFTGLWVQTHEPDEAEREIVRHAREKKWKIAIWDIANGLRLPANPGTARHDAGTGDPLAVLRALPSLAEKDGTAVLLLHNFHRVLNSPEVVQTTFSQLVAGKQQRTFIVVLSAVVNIPVELEKLFVVLHHELPGREQLEQIARELTADEPAGLPQGESLQRVLDAAAGLTRYEAEGSFALSIARHNVIRPDVVTELKAQTLKKNNLLTLHRGGERFDSLGGLQTLKDFCRRALSLKADRKVQPRGIMLLGVPGTGKSSFARALGTETGRPTLLLDIGALYGSLVGATEQNVRQALRIIDAMAPCVAFIDEVEKALAGLGGSGDSGVASRLFGTLLSWLSDRESDVFVVCTSNDVSKLPPEFTRAERFDACFFLDLPGDEEKNAIWNLYRQQFGIPPSQSRPDDTSWTGAEIRACCRLAALLDVTLVQAAHHVVPVAITAAEQVEKLRSWASGRCLDASRTGIFQRDGEEASRPSRRVQRGPNNN
jgi:ATPase family associated with various cellular activities (AAA)